MALINIDENRWPIVIITLSGNETENDVRDFLDKLEDFRTSDEEFCFVLDLREINRLSPKVRDVLISWLKKADFHELAGTAIVVSSPLMRIYLSVGLWISRMLHRQSVRYKHTTVESLSEAYEWSRKRLHIHKPGATRKSVHNQ